MVMRILPVPVIDVRLVMHTDGAFQNAHGRRCNLRHHVWDLITHDLSFAAPVLCLVR